jgi:hypothetical protein
VTAAPGAATSGQSVGSVPAAQRDVPFRGSQPPALLDPCLARLDQAIQAAEALGVPVADARTVAADAITRLGFPAEAYLVALVGGTGVGKSSVLNRLAGAEISPASVRRPTTATPVAWLPRSAADDLAPVLVWLGVASDDIRFGPDAGASDAPPGAPSGGSVAVLDLPDLDSIEPEHRRRVDEILPRVDAVIWLTDPEKYHDALLHDEFLARWLPRLGRQLVVVNKADRLAPDDAERLRRDLERDIVRLARPGRDSRASAGPRVVVASTRSEDGLSDVRGWLEEGAEAKQVVRGRLIATIRDTVDALARAAGLDPAAPPRPVLAAEVRREAADRASGALLRVVDLPALRRQAVGATRARARARGAGPLGGLTSRLFRWSGRQARVADPGAYLARWRDRGTPGPAAGEIAARLAEPLRTAAPGTRRILATETSSERLEQRLGAAVDRAIAADPGEPPTSAWWTVIGVAQTIATGALVLIAIWVALWVFVKFPVDSAILPVLGQVPMPFIALILAVVVGYLLARLLGLHAGWLGRRWAAALADRIRDNVRTEVGSSTFAVVDRIEADRAALAMAARGVREDCTTG